MLALCDLRKKSHGLQKLGIPAEGDLQALQDILDTDFPTWKEYIKAQAKKHLNKALVKEAATNATNAVLPIVKKPITEQVLAKAKGEVLPKIINNAKSSGKSAAKRVFDDRRGHIIAIGLIPFYGGVKARMLIADAKRDAINDAKNAAKAAVNSQFNSPAIKDQMKEISTRISASVFAQHKTQVKQAINTAVDDTLKRHKPMIEKFNKEIK